MEVLWTLRVFKRSLTPVMPEHRKTDIPLLILIAQQDMPGQPLYWLPAGNWSTVAGIRYLYCMSSPVCAFEHVYMERAQYQMTILLLLLLLCDRPFRGLRFGLPIPVYSPCSSSVASL